MTQQKVQGEGQEEKKEFPPILRNILVGIGGFVSAVVLVAAFAKWGIENVVKGIALPIVLMVVVFATRRFWKLVFSSFRNVVIFLLVISVFALVAFLLFLGEKALGFIATDQTLISPIVVALLIAAVAGWFIHLFNGSDNQHSIMTLVIFLSAMVYVLVAIILGRDEGVRFAFVFVTAFEVVALRLAIPSFLRVKKFKSNIYTKFGRRFVTGCHGLIFIGFMVEAVILPIFMVATWPLSNWQIVTTCLSVPVSWYILYEVWGKKYL